MTAKFPIDASPFTYGLGRYGEDICYIFPLFIAKIQAEVNWLHMELAPDLSFTTELVHHYRTRGTGSGTYRWPEEGDLLGKCRAYVSGNWETWWQEAERVGQGHAGGITAMEYLATGGPVPEWLENYQEET